MSYQAVVEDIVFLQNFVSFASYPFKKIVDFYGVHSAIRYSNEVWVLLLLLTLSRQYKKKDYFIDESNRMFGGRILSGEITNHLGTSGGMLAQEHFLL